MTKASAYTVKRIDKDVFELWHEDECLATLTKEQAWPVMMGQVHPSDVVDDLKMATTTYDKEQQ